MYEHASLGPKTDFEQASQWSLSIAVVTPRFAISGVPLAQLRLARALADFGHKVELIIGLLLVPGEMACKPLVLSVHLVMVPAALVMVLVSFASSHIFIFDLAKPAG